MTPDLAPKSKIAVVGSGVAGIVAAFLLQERYEVSLFEEQNRIGGHTNTVVVPHGSDSEVPIDTGFIVLNDRTYPAFSKFLSRLGVTVQPSDMSFGFECRRTGFAYAGTSLNGLFANRRHLVTPDFYRFLREICRFCSLGKDFLAHCSPATQPTLGRFLASGGFSSQLRDDYLLPIAAAIWSAPPGQILDFPARTFLTFFANHGLLSLRDRPTWQTVRGGSRTYLDRFEKGFLGTIYKGAKVRRITGENDGATLFFDSLPPRRFDAVVIATHADQAIRLLGDPESLESHLLGPWRYQRNEAFLHMDESLMPRNRRAWASWNFVREDAQTVTDAVPVTYHMNRLQRLKTGRQYFVTLNPQKRIPDDQVIYHTTYEHPVFDESSLNTQPRLAGLQGGKRRYFCGSYFGYGFHEDAVQSAVALGRLFGVTL
ncbi:MAG: NAD(P)-binding protein [Bdellovibrionota bacterium]